MITSKQRAELRAVANKTDAIFQLGKSGITPEFITMLSDALEKREIVKITVLNSAVINAEEAADIISGRTKSDVVQVIGKKITFYRKSKKSQSVTK